MHNKPNKTALDSSTMTGKVIDSIIKELPNCDCLKSNICNRDYLPKDGYEIQSCCIEWCEKVKPETEDIIVLLGRWVRDNFFVNHKGVIINATHPAGIFGTTNKSEYVKNIVAQILTQKP